MATNQFPEPEEDAEENEFTPHDLRHYNLDDPTSDSHVTIDQTRPFAPNIRHNVDENNDIIGYECLFNQAYIFNTVSESQWQGDGTPIQGMNYIHDLEIGEHKKYYVEVILDAENFLISGATFTGYHADGDQPTSSFPEIIFEQLQDADVEKTVFTGYLPVLELNDGYIEKLNLADNIILSDRQHKQLGISSGCNSAHILVSGEKDNEFFPVRHRAISGGSGVTVEETDKYIIIHASGASGASGDWSGENVGYQGVGVYNEYTLMPAEFHKIYGDNSTSNVTVEMINHGGDADKSNDYIQVSAAYDNCSDTLADADHWSYKGIAGGEAQFRGLKTGDGIKFTKDVDHETNYCTSTISARIESCGSANWEAFKGFEAGRAKFRGFNQGCGITFADSDDCVATIKTQLKNCDDPSDSYLPYKGCADGFEQFHPLSVGTDDELNLTITANGSCGYTIAGSCCTSSDDYYISDYLIHTSDTNTKMGFPADDTIDFYTAGSARMTIKSDGKIGIGSAVPSHTLTVDGSIGGSSFGISDGKAVLIDGSPSDDQYARFTANGLEGRSASDVRSDLSLGSLATLSAVDADSVTVSNLEVDNFKAATIVTESEGIGSNDNDTTLPTSAAVKDYVDNNDGNVYVSSAAFGTSDGVLTLTRTDSATVTVDLDGRYQDEITSSSRLNANLIGANGDVSNTEFGYLDGVTSAIQTQIDGKQASLTFGISNTNAVKIDSASVADDEFARFTSSGLESRSASEVRSDLSLGSLATLSAVDADSVTVSNLEVDNFKAATIVTESEGIGSNDNDTTIPTSAAVKDYVDSNDGNVYVSSAAFGTSDGVLTLTRTDSATVTVDLDGRYQDEITSSSRLNANLIGSGNVSNAEFDYLDGVTSAIQTQLDAKQATISASSRLNANLIGSSGDVSNTEFDYLNGVTSAIQTQLDGKQATIGDGDLTIARTSGLQAALDGKQASLTFGISNTNAVKIDSASVADDEFARFTSSGLESRSASEVRSDLSLGSLATLSAVDADSVTVSNLEVDNFKAATIVTESEGIGSNDNDTTIPTSAAVKDYVDNNDGNVYVSSAAFGTSDGVLTLTRTDSATVTVDLDGRYQDEITSSSRLNANLIGSGNVSNTEFDYLDGVTSAIQTQLDAKQATISASSRLNANLIGSSGNVSNTEFDYLDGVTSAIQTQLDAKLSTSGGTLGGNLVMGSNQIKFANDGKLRLGDSNDLDLYHNGTHSYIDNGTTGDLFIRNNGENSVIIGHNANKGLIYVPDDRVELRFNDSKKFETTSVGAKITGLLNVDTVNNNDNTANIIYRSGTTTIVGNNADALVVHDGGDVGIGTTSNNSGIGLQLQDGDFYVYSGNIKADNINAGYFASSRNLELQGGSAAGVKLMSGSTVVLQTTSSAVGIGETAPSETLEVAGNILAKDSGVLAGVGGDKDGFIFHDLYTSGGKYWGYKAFSGSNRLSIVTDGVERLTVDANGRVGIANTAPSSYTLTVDGSIGGTAFGISDGKGVLVDGSPSDDQYARFTANGIEGRSASDVRSDLSLGSLATLSAVDADSVTVSNLEVDNFKAATIVTESEGIGSNDNDTTIPTSAAVKDYVDSNDGNVYVSSAAFGTSDGVLTLTRTDSATVTVDLDGRYQDEITSSSRLNANLIGSGNVSNAEFDYLDGVTSAIQTQLDAKQATISASSRLNANLIGSSGDVSNTEFDYLNGVTSAIQTQLDGKQATIGDGDLTIARTSGLQTALDAKQATIDSSSRLSATLVGANGNVSNTEFGYLDGVTSAIQTQLDGKQATIGYWNRLSATLVGANGNVSNTEYGYLNGVTSAIQTQLNDRYTESEIQTFMDHSYISKEGANDLAVGWYTIATNTGNRATARFGIWDTDSSRHQSVTFYAAHKYGNASADTITVLDTSHYGTSPFRYIRIKAGGTYDGAALQVYIDNAQNSLNAAILGDNFQSDSWVLCDFIPDADTPPLVSNYGSFTESSRIDLDEIAQGGFATTGPIYADGDTSQYKVLTTNDFGISDGNAVKCGGSVADNDFLRIDGTEVEGRTASQVKDDLGLGSSDDASFGSLTIDSLTHIDTDGTYGASYGAIGIGTSNLTNGHHRIFAKSSDHMYFAAASSKGFRFRPNGGSTTASAGISINSSGYLGIGTTNASNYIDVNGGIAIGASYVGASAPSNGAIIEGNLGVGYSSPSYKLHVNGSIVGSYKSFLIDHPTKEGKQLMHSCLEGPEHGVYLRGQSDLNIIKMPDYWKGLVHIDTMSVTLTAIGPNQNIYVDSIAENGDVAVGSNTEEPLNYFYVVHAERKDIDKLEIEIPNSEFG